MKQIEINYIEKIIGIMKNNELTEVSLEDAEQSLYIRTSGFTPVAEIKNKEEQKIEKIEIIQEEENKEADKKKIIPVVSNMIGLFFIKPSPEGKPFVQVGEKVKAGQQIGIIETIKLMNKIVSDVSGTVKEICIDNGKPVEYGQTMMYIEQD